ncbi:hypothetical protein IMCC3317_18180 [Kordia antarctica]|uniref:Uncharacterized protein n=1 Tax=Kordia antarctica TaxID=1218801 RepID=A0A7L4ZIM4_9FLAO|nr:hypothetical protein [Kordia antarctica]QHI36455.1 hypothetical protein IMCC3317_18180 [Kordia antarctica]
MKTKALKMATFMGIILTLVFACSKESSNDLAEITASEATASKQAVVFIAGYDKGSSTYYKDAKKHFQELSYTIIDDAFSLQEIISWLNKNHNEQDYSEIHIVNKGNSKKGLSLETTIHGELLSQETLLNCLKENKLPTLENVLAADSKLVFHTSELGKNKNLLQVLKQTFTANYQPKVFATQHATVFNGQFQKHFLAKVFYGYYPTAQSPGNVDLSKQFINKYPLEDIHWLDAIRTKEEGEPGEAFAYKFNIPIRWEIQFSDDDEIPSLADGNEIMDWIDDNEAYKNIITDMGISVEKFRWKAVKVGQKVIIKGKTTAVCILKPMMQRNNPLSYVRTEFDNQRYYTQL